MHEDNLSGSGDQQERESMEFDVVIVGAGPAGLAAAIRLKQINKNLSVVVLEKSGEIGGHVLSGAVVDPIAIDRLLPDWKNDEESPLKTLVKKEHFLLLTRNRKFNLPNFVMPHLMGNHGNYIVSLGNVCRWLGKKAEELGVEIYPGFAAAHALYEKERLIGVATGDMGVLADGSPGVDFSGGMALLGKYVLIAEGARGSLAKEIMIRYGLSRDREPQKFGIGIKELWEVAGDRHEPGNVYHSFGWPLGKNIGGGSFLYHLEDNRVAVGLVVHLDYKNPYLSPFEEFQRFKTHSAICGIFEGGRRISYGARALTEGGWQSVPKLSFPGGALIGCASGFMNVPRIKGSHNAMLSGMQAAEAVAEALESGRSGDELDVLDEQWKISEIGQELKKVRNVKPLWSRFGTPFGIILAGIDMWSTSLFGGWSPFGTMKHGKPDHECMEPANKHVKINYPEPDGKLTFDRSSSVFLSNVNHEAGQPSHLKLLDSSLQKNSEHDIFSGPSGRYCPAGVYEWVEEDGEDKFVINFQNCVHCKTCDIKDPNQNINWTCPQGGEGPFYGGM